MNEEDIQKMQKELEQKQKHNKSDSLLTGLGTLIGVNNDDVRKLGKVLMDTLYITIVSILIISFNILINWWQTGVWDMGLFFDRLLYSILPIVFFHLKRGWNESNIKIENKWIMKAVEMQDRLAAITLTTKLQEMELNFMRKMGVAKDLNTVTPN